MIAAPAIATIATPAGAHLNHLLRALPRGELNVLAGQLEPVRLRLGDAVYEPGSHLPYAIFPTTAIVSLLYVTATGASAETASVGNEGMVGLALFMGGDTTASSARVLVAGDALRLPAAQLREGFGRSSLLRNLLLRYAQLLMTQIAQNSVCNRHHAIEQQFCRWMLGTLDRAPTQDLVITQELVAHTLGVRRESITEAALLLQQTGVIRYRRGQISVLDRAGLEQRSCECYRVVRKEQDRLMPAVTSAPVSAPVSARVSAQASAPMSGSTSGPLPGPMPGPSALKPAANA